MENKKEPYPGCLIMAAVMFGIAALITILGFIFGGESFLSDLLANDDDGVSGINFLRLLFLILVITGGVYVYNKYIKKEKQ